MVRARQASISLPRCVPSSVPATNRWPLLAPRKPAISASQVDLPVPERPRTSSVPPWRRSTSGNRSGTEPPMA